jgi:quinohemoprotein ethanol dehydrogenase
VCHGGSVLPDLRRSAALTDKAAWNQIVIGGVLSSQGMASFARWLKPEEAESIRAYVAEDARTLEKETAAK